MTVKPDQSNLSVGGEKTTLQQEQNLIMEEELFAEIVKQVTHESGMDVCPICNGTEKVFNAVQPQKAHPITGIVMDYLVMHKCEECAKGWKVTITIGEDQVLRATLASGNDQYQLTMHLFFLVLKAARQQILAHIEHLNKKTTTDEVVETD